ncbi:MAG: polysaccharide lyase [Jatrophihabitans sp.]|uniref:polysaccharide lyase n=1 Tax=Jatrophihabitans sp. TaxID=1932789 RepID=UPI003F7FB91B
MNLLPASRLSSPLGRRGRGARSRGHRPVRHGRTTLLVAGALTLSGAVSIVTADTAHGATVPQRRVAADYFHRTVVSGLGRAGQGGAYVLTRPANVGVHVAANRATFAALTPGQTVTASLPSVVVGDARMRTSIVVPKLPTGAGGFHFGLELRQQQDGRGYRASVAIDAQGGLTVSLSRLGHNRAETTLRSRRLAAHVRAGQVLNLVGMVRGTAPASLALRAWVAGHAIPDWQLQYQDRSTGLVPRTGTVGEWSYLSSRTASPRFQFQQTLLLVWALKAAAGVTPPPSGPPARTGSTTIFAQNYDRFPTGGPVSLQTERSALGDQSLYLGSSNIGRTSIVAAAGHGNVMRITMPANTIGEASGAIIDAHLPRTVDQATIKYDIRFGSNFDWSRGGKLPGLGGATPGTRPSVAGGCNAGNSGAWSGRGMWITPSSYPSVAGPNELIGYAYDYAKQSTCGDNQRTNTAMTAGTWHSVTMSYRMNTIGSNGVPHADGVFKMWLDGRLIKDVQNLQYRNTANLHINYLYWEVFRGGGDQSWAGRTTSTIDFDNLSITTG